MVTIYTSTPIQLLQRFKEAIDKGHVVTWKYFGDGDFTHTPQQWTSRAYMRPSTESGKLKFNIVKPSGSGVSAPIYAVYQGRLIESFLEHFDTSFSDASATALAAAGDIVQ